MTYFVTENQVNLRYTWQFGLDHYFELTTPSSSMTTNEFHATCLKMGNADFPLNKNMCDFVKTTYGEYIVYSLLPSICIHLKNLNMLDIVFGNIRSTIL